MPASKIKWAVHTDSVVNQYRLTKSSLHAVLMPTCVTVSHLWNSLRMLPMQGENKKSADQVLCFSSVLECDFSFHVTLVFSTDSLLAQRQRCHGYSNLQLVWSSRFGSCQEASSIAGPGHPIQQSQNRTGQEGEQKLSEWWNTDVCLAASITVKKIKVFGFILA